MILQQEMATVEFIYQKKFKSTLSEKWQENIPCMCVMHASKQLKLSCPWAYPLEHRVHL